MPRTAPLLVLLVACAEPPPALDAGAPGRIEQEPAAAAPSAPPQVWEAAATAPPQAAARPRPPAPHAGDVVAIAAGTLRVGSRPGWPGRNPAAEADLVAVEVAGFDVDALPFPNDPARPAELVATRAEAARACEARGRRLCHELEWERACRGDTDEPFATGDALDLAACVASPTACPSSTGVFDLGVRAPEWTASDADERLAHLARTAVARGGRPEHSEAAHRCGSRHATDPNAPPRPLAFRCCGGEPPALSYPDVGVRRTFRDLALETDRWREILAAVPELARYAGEFTPHTEQVAARALARGGASPETVAWSVAPGPFAWSPTTGEEVWIVSGQSGGVGLLAALYPTPDGAFHHAASFLFDERDTPIAVLRTPGQRRELLWTTCWACGGESGAILLDDDTRVVIVQR